MQLQNVPNFTISKTVWLNAKIALAASKKNVPDQTNISEELILVTHAALLSAWERKVLQNPAGIKVTSLFRNYIPIGGATNSAHLTGKAIDIVFNTNDLKRIQEDIRNNPSLYKSFAGIGFYKDGHIHFDVNHRATNGAYKPHFAFWSDLPEDEKKNDNVTQQDVEPNNNFQWLLLLAVVPILYLFFKDKMK